MMPNEIPVTQSISQLTEIMMESIPVFKAEPASSENQLVNSRKAVLRGLFRPMVLSMLGTSKERVNENMTPESVIKAMIERPDLNGDEDLIKLIKERFGIGTSSPIETKWLDEALKISLEGISHPLSRLSQVVISKMPADLRTELTRFEFPAILPH